MKHLQLKIYGQVQGVFFRDGVREKALVLDLVGYVKNLEDGSLEVMVEGEEERLKKMLEWCKIGPRDAKVEKVEETWQDKENKEFSDFKIVY